MRKLVKGTRVIVGMSGGLVSSVVAGLLKKQGCEVIGVTLTLNNLEQMPKRCKDTASCFIEGQEHAATIARDLQIAHHYIDISRYFDYAIVEPFFHQSFLGHLDYPCLRCTGIFKPQHLFQKAKELNVEWVATGHFAKITYDKQLRRFLLCKAQDEQYDQSKFLFGLKQEQIAKLLLPVGSLNMKEIVDIALRFEFKMKERPLSQQPCFFKGLSKADFIKSKVPPDLQKPGWILDRYNHMLGQHIGLEQYEIGQSQDISGIKVTSGAWTVVRLDPLNYAIYVEEQKKTMTSEIIVGSVNWISEPNLHQNKKCKIHFLTNTEAKDVIVQPLLDCEARVHFSETISLMAPGQPVAFFQDYILIGGGFVKECICAT